MHQVAIHLVKARDEMEARARGTEMGVGRQHAYRNGDGEEVFWAFRRVVECQDLADREFVDGTEVSCWLYEGERLCLNDGWSLVPEPS